MAKAAKKTAVAAKRWNAKCKAAKMLREGLRNGTIDPNGTPKALYETEEEFQEYSLDQFRSNLNKIKAELGVHMRSKYYCATCLIYFTLSN